MNNHSKLPENKASISVYYNSACPVCEKGIKNQQSRMETCPVNWNDVHTVSNIYKEAGSDIEFIRQRLHVIDRDGKLNIGFDAFISLWRDSPGEKWKADLFSIPIIHGTSSVAYNAFAWILYKCNRLLKRW